VANNYVYFIRDRDSGLVKIGQSKHPDIRLTDLRAERRNIEILGTIAAPLLERELHRQFAHCRVVGEWFRPDDDLAFLVNSHRDRPDITGGDEINHVRDIHATYFKVIGPINFWHLFIVASLDIAEGWPLVPTKFRFAMSLHLSPDIVVPLIKFTIYRNGHNMRHGVERDGVIYRNGNGVEIVE
jgi:hypothetical protein